MLKIAEERISILMDKAKEAAEKEDFALSKRYVNLARRIAMKVQLSMPRKFKRKFCKKCQVYWIPSKTVRVRSKRKNKRMIFTCLVCGAIQRFPFNKKEKKGNL